MTVYVEGVVLRSHAENVPLDQLANACPEDRGVSDEGAGIDRLEVVCRAEEDEKLRSGRRACLPRIDSAPYIPPSIDSCMDGEWSW